jgi:hypothetical protein
MQLNIKKNRFPLAFLMSLLIVLTSCKKLVDIDPPVTSVSGASVYTSDATATAVLTGIYAQLSSGSYSGYQLPTLTLYAGLSADELTLWGGVTNISQKAYYANSLSVSASTGSDYWSSIYPYIFTCNSALEGLSASSSLTPAVKQQLLGEAKFMRAYFYFYLVNLYGDIPMPLSSDYKVNATLSKTPKAQVYQQIITDLQSAQQLLSNNFVDASLQKVTFERTRPNKWAATALLARAYLYYAATPGADAASNYANAYNQSNTMIANSAPFTLGLLPTLNSVFLKNSNEAIWQLQPILNQSSSNTFDGLLFIVPATGPSPSWPVYMSNSLLSAFETGDNRRSSWVGSVTAAGTTYYYPYKYKQNTPTAAVTEYLMMLRLGEQYLIRAEAQANGAGGGISGAIADLNAIRNRAGLPNYAGATDKNSVITAILHERRVEMFTEMGQRWLDLKRTGAVDAVMQAVAPQKQTTWQSYQQFYPLPLADLQADANLKQNNGY